MFMSTADTSMFEDRHVIVRVAPIDRIGSLDGTVASRGGIRRNVSTRVVVEDEECSGSESRSRHYCMLGN
jgi:hypothetical protein